VLLRMQIARIGKFKSRKGQASLSHGKDASLRRRALKDAQCRDAELIATLRTQDGIHQSKHRGQGA